MTVDSLTNNETPEDSVAKLAGRIAQLSPAKRILLERALAAKRLSGCDAVAESLRKCGITHVFGIAGKPTEKILPACLNQGIRPIGVHQHSAAVFMATAFNYQMGRLAAVALTSAGPAVTNTITGLLVARDNAWPVVVLGGRRSSFQKSNLLPMIRQVTKAAIDVPKTSSINHCIQDACRTAVSGRPGPVYLELHEDVLNGRTGVRPDSDSECSILNSSCPSITENPAVSVAKIEEIATALLSARRPALLLGKGVRWSVNPSLLQHVIETLSLPFITSPMGRGFVPEDHPLCFNRARTVLQSQADVVLVLGARLNWVFRHGAELSRDARVFCVDVHPDGKDNTGSHTEFVHADAGDFLDSLLRSIQNRITQMSQLSRRQWLQTLNATSSETRRRLDQQTAIDGDRISPYRMMKEIRDALPRDAICVTDGNVSMMAAQAVIPAYRPASRMDAGSNACMGVGVPFAIGAKVAQPDRTVVVVTGDYAFGLGAMEMEVCVRHGIPIVVVVANNQGNNGAIKQRAYFPGDNSELVTMFQPGLEYDRIMKVFGGDGATISDPNLIKSKLKEAISAGVPCCLNIVVDPEFPLPNAWGEQRSSGVTDA